MCFFAASCDPALEVQFDTEVKQSSELQVTNLGSSK